jgi:formylglycine-generating enzyme required for sulfatase activity
MKTKVIVFLLFLLAGNTIAQKKPDIQWVNIPAGTFTMGSPENELGRETGEVQHSVTISAFRMSNYEVTFDQYDMFCDATGRNKPADGGWGRGNRPVINVTWEDARAFAEWMNCRLPTEAEWEYACRAGTTTPFNTGENILTAEANYDGTFPYSNFKQGELRGKTLPVGSFKPNAWGLYDMHGNVWEWCQDWLAPYSMDPQTNPKGPTYGNLHIGRGGSWKNMAQRCRSAYRYARSANHKSNVLGFRIATEQ